MGTHAPAMSAVPGNAAPAAQGASHAPWRVLHLRDSPWLDGPGRTILETAAHVDRSRVDFFIGALVSKEGTHPLLAGARARGLQSIAIKDPGGGITGLVDQIMAVVEQHDIQVLHASDFRTSLAALLCRRRRRSLKVVATAHGWIANTLRRRVFRFLDKFLLRQFDRVVLVSHAMRRLVPRWWLPDRRVTVMHNALVLESYGQEARQRSRPPVSANRDVVMLNIGRLSPEKGQAMLLDALKQLLVKWPNLKLQFAGVGPLEASLRAQAEAAGIASRVEFLGYITDMPPLYANCDLVVQSSFTEGLPNVILEAAFLRVPIVATDVGGTREVVQHDHSACIIRPSTEELVAGIDSFMSDPARFAAMADRAHDNIMAKFSFAARTSNLMQFYDELLSGAPAGAGRG
jgi:glycosyltransferase involved in cell wall biosynthesis